jgi:hypothetical protein
LDGAGTPGAQGRQYDHDLHACAAARWARGAESARSALSSVMHRSGSPFIRQTEAHSHAWRHQQRRYQQCHQRGGQSPSATEVAHAPQERRPGHKAQEHRPQPRGDKGVQHNNAASGQEESRGHGDDPIDPLCIVHVITPC